MRELKGKLAIGLTIWAALAVCFHIYTGYFGSFEPRIQRSVHLIFLLPIAFILFPSKRSKKDSKPTVVDWLFVVLSLLPSLYLIINVQELNQRILHVGEVTLTQILLGTLIIILVIESCRRAVSPVFACVVSLFIVYMFSSPYLGGLFKSRGISYSRFTENLFLASDQGIYGYLLGISSNVLFVFIAFAAIMICSGVGDYFRDLSITLAGKYRGGPAKITVVSSGLYGSISGSSVADVYATGSFSIPLMKKVGYPPIKAGAIEAVASAGGPLMPPVMGAAAFVMAEMTGTSYTMIVKAAILGAILYYIGVIAVVHFEAVKLNIGKSPIEWNVSIKNLLMRSPYFIPYAVMIYFLFSGYSPAKSTIYAIIATIIIWVLNPINRINIKDLAKGVNFAIRGATIIACALAGAGIIVSVLSETGAALALGNIVMKLSFGNLWLSLLLIMIVTLVLGAGIPTTPAYIITATIAAGALYTFDLPLISVHMFIFYYAIMADITPPVGVTAFSSATLAGSPPMKTALMTPQFAFAGFIVPYLFIMNPQLLLYDGYSWISIVLAFLSATVIIVALASVVVGYFFNKFNWYRRVILALLLVIAIGDIWNLAWIAMLLIVLFIVFEYVIHRANSKRGLVDEIKEA